MTSSEISQVLFYVNLGPHLTESWRNPNPNPGLHQCPSLHSLSLPRCRGITDVSPLAACPMLTVLNLKRCRGIISLHGLGQCPVLRCLDLSHCYGLRDVSSLTQSLSLRKIKIFGMKPELLVEVKDSLGSQVEILVATYRQQVDDHCHQAEFQSTRWRQHFGLHGIAPWERDLDERSDQ